MENKYILNQGESDTKRLDSLSEIYDNNSKKFIIENIAENSVAKIIDVGCGQGSITKFFANQYPNAKVIALDISQDQLVISKNKMINETNIEYLSVDIESDSITSELWEKLQSADLIYIRYLLLHLKKWEIFFDNIYKILKKGGQIIIEEPGFPWITYPYSETLQKASVAAQKLLHNLNYKFDCIPHLWEFLNQQNQFKIKNVDFSHPILKTYNQKSLMWMSFAQIKEPLIKAKVYDEVEFNNIVSELKKIAEDPKYIGISLRLIQLHLEKI
ncbi:class I SAM-dependent methyltransferase [Spiroplasma platyhelix]|uniref:Class I SAM-dependent methyltransferase n=1 Tax=Spiroplasma platyhelix PALS-1 TaxID=1276218 RepID=A0A846U485_9MOLU|nr:class I SAM-dependent methyltransferase [Spiroplasma platyhelix]MBE4703894.1 Ubiquinone/menaquinone biosynthesis C-methyltransferase UbiE [Spiroplasma platyhelix PALS-1]NKE38267.1 class I SAM-dependent methyltransferase [Spiroplasma platyhelix PALS-1]UJB29152.1 hypothetical protein SPLAT_v1c03880 [Spiroplasma platyhelix PALS-1]